MDYLLIKGGTVYDGTGAPGQTADVVVNSGRITKIGRADSPAKRTIDADGLVVSPGLWMCTPISTRRSFGIPR